METIKYDGQWITLPWAGWEGIEISPVGIRSNKGTIKISAIVVALWRQQSGRNMVVFTENTGEEIRMMLD